MSLPGGYTQFKMPTEDSMEVLRKVYDEIANHGTTLSTITLESLLSNHVYATQVVAGLNYKFKVMHEGVYHSFVVWKKLNGTHKVSFS